MSTAEAMEFYSPVREILRTRLNDTVAAKAKSLIEKELAVKISAKDEKALGDLLGPLSGDHQFENIVKFMSGRAPSECDAAELNQQGTEK